MRSKYATLTLLAALTVFAFAWIQPAAAQTVNVTFTVNTATNLDTLGESGVVQIRGAILKGDGSTQEGDILPGGGNISWSSASTLIFNNVGGDYWQGTFELNVGDTLTYKYWTGHDMSTGTNPDGGWEGGFNDTQGTGRDTRILIVGSKDTTLQVQYYQPGGGAPAKDEFTPPFEMKPDTTAIYFRVNMQGVTELGLFDPDVNGPVGIRGDNAVSGGNIDWGTTKVLLNREHFGNGDGTTLWSGTAYIPTDSLTAGSVQNYKFFVENKGGVDWEGDIGNRTFTYTASLIARADTTIHWVHFNDKVPTGQVTRQSVITFRVSTEALEGIGLFDRGVGDRIAVIGAKGWDRPADFIDMNFIPALQEWTVAEPFTSIPGTDISYKYFVIWDSTRVDSTSPNYIPGLSLDFGWEEPSVVGGANRTHVFEDADNQTVAGDYGFDRQFYASVPQNGWFANDIAVTFNIDMAPAKDAASNTNPLFDPATDSVFISPDGSLLAVAQGIGNTFGERAIRLEDPDGDMIYSGTWNIKGPGWYQLGYVVTYGNDTDGYINNGGGFAKGRRYYQFIHPINVAADGSTTWPSEFNLPTLSWKESNLDVEDPPDLTQPTSVSEDGSVTPRTFALRQNYPNPFNPSTTIQYRVAIKTDVKVRVFNTLGQLVKTLVDDEQAPGNYSVTWHGDSNRGQIVSTGIYFLKMKAGEFNKVRKMAFVR